MGSLGLGFRRPHRLYEAPLGRSRPFLWRRWSSASKAVPEPHETCRELGVQTCLGLATSSPHMCLGVPSGGLAGTPRAPRHTVELHLTSKWWCSSVGIAEASGNKYPLWHLKKKGVKCLELKGWLLINLFILVVLGLCSTHKLSLVVAARRGYSLVAVCRLLISVTSPVSENRL